MTYFPRAPDRQNKMWDLSRHSNVLVVPVASLNSKPGKERQTCNMIFTNDISLLVADPDGATSHLVESITSSALPEGVCLLTLSDPADKCRWELELQRSGF